MVSPVHSIHDLEGRQAFFQKALYAQKVNRIGGDYVEFGSYGAATFRMAYHESRGAGLKPHLWSFDSFQGLPAPEGNEHPLWQQGVMAMPLPAFVHTCLASGMTTDDFSVVEGFYDQTLSAQNIAQAKYPADIMLAYVDCDLYSSTKPVLDFLGTRLKNGMIIAFDDYYCWWDKGVAGERVAFEEFRAKHSDYNFLPYLPIGWHGQSFVVEDRKFLNWAEVQKA